MVKTYHLFLLSFLLLSGILQTPASGQNTPEHSSNRVLYDFLDELAIHHIIDLVSVAKPYSRTYIAQKLQEAQKKQHQLNPRQQHMLQTFLRDYALETTINKPDVGKGSLALQWLPPELSYQDKQFSFSLKPIWGIRYYTNENGTVRHTHGGAEARAKMGDNWSVWASVRDNYQTNQILSSPNYLNQREGGAWKRNVQGRVGGDYSEMRAGIAYSWNWGTVALQKDHLQWGDNHHGANILSGRTPSYPMVSLHLHPAKWLSFHYHHGWLVSMQVDSTRTYIPYEGSPERRFYHNKYIAANLFTITPIPRLDISLGNSVVYSEADPYPGYLIPFMFFKSVVHTHTERRSAHNQNSAMYLNLSSRQIKHLHLYFTWFIDEFSKARIGDPERLNFTSTKAGFRLSGWPVQNTSLTAEYTFTYPKTFQHRTPTTTYESNHYNLGHYMEDNATDAYVALDIQPWRNLQVRIAYADARKGNLRPYLYGIEPRAQDTDPFMEETIWRNTTASLQTRYVLYNNVSIFAEAHRKHIRAYEADNQTPQYYMDQFGPPLFHGKTLTISAGLQMGF